MDKVLNLLKKLGIELTADQTAQVREVLGKEFVAAEDAAKKNTELEELKKQLADRDKDLEKLKSENNSAELAQKLAELEAKYKTDTENLTAKRTAFRRVQIRERARKEIRAGGVQGQGLQV